MGKYRVTGPDGKAYMVTAPDGATREQIMARVQAHAAPKRAAGSGVPTIDQALSSVNEFLIGVPQGLYNAAATVTDPIANAAIRVFSGKETADRTMQAARKQRKAAVDAISRAMVSRPSPVARTAGQIAGTLLPPVAGIKAPAALARIAPKAVPVLTRAMQGAIGGAATRGDDSSGLTEAAIGAGAGVVLPPALSYLATSRPVRAVGRGVANIARPAVNAVSSMLDNTPALPPVAARAAPTPTISDAFGRDAAARAARFRAVGAENPTTGMVTRDPRAWNFERETAKLSGAGDDLVSQIRKVERDIVRAGDDLVRAQGGSLGAEGTGLSVQRALDAKRNEMQKATSALYKSVREGRGDVSAGPLNALRGALDDPAMTDNPIFDTMREGINRRLQRFGMAGTSGMVRNDAVATVSQAEELRKMIGSLGPSNEPAVRMMRGRLIDALDDDVTNSVGDDAFKAARASAKARFDEFSKTFAGRIADEGIAPEKLTQRLLGATPLSDIRALRRSLTSGTQDQIARGTEALRGLRAQSLDELFGGVVSADGKLNGSQLHKLFQKNADKYRALFDAGDYKQIRRIALAARDATSEVPFSAVNNSNTASAAANMFQRLPESNKKGILGLLAKHAAGFTMGGPAANISMIVADEALKRRAASQAGDLLARQVSIASSPEMAARVAMEQGLQGTSDEGLAALIKRWQNITGNNPVIGGVTASAATNGQ